MKQLLTKQEQQGRASDRVRKKIGNEKEKPLNKLATILTQAERMRSNRRIDVLRNCSEISYIECVHDSHVGGPKQYNDFPLGNIFYFYANIFYCFSPPTWLPCTHSKQSALFTGCIRTACMMYNKKIFI